MFASIEKREPAAPDPGGVSVYFHFTGARVFSRQLIFISHSEAGVCKALRKRSH